MLNWSLKNIFGMEGPNKVWWAASDLGWVVGHSYICYAPLLAGITTILYEGKPVGTPNAAQFYRFSRLCVFWVLEIFTKYIIIHSTIM